MEFEMLIIFACIWLYLGIGYWVTMKSINAMSKESRFISDAFARAKHERPAIFYLLLAILIITWLPGLLIEIGIVLFHSKTRKEYQDRIKEEMLREHKYEIFQKMKKENEEKMKSSLNDKESDSNTDEPAK